LNNFISLKFKEEQIGTVSYCFIGVGLVMSIQF